MLNLYSLSVIIFFAVVAIILYLQRKKIDVRYHILFMRRTKKFGKLIDDIANISPRFWKGMSFIGILVCCFYSLYGIYLILTVAVNVLLGTITQPGFQVVLPSLSSSGTVGSGYILIPFWSWIIVIFSILVPHELSHGIISRAYKIRLKSVGLMLFAIFPGAFVEPDEKQINRSKAKTKLSIYAAGSAANFLVAFIILIFVMFAFWPALTAPGIEVTAVNETSPAFQSGLRNNTVITHVNGEPLEVSYCEYNYNFVNFLIPGIDICKSGSGYFTEEVGRVKINDTIILKDDTGKAYNIKIEGRTASFEGLQIPYMGINYLPRFNTNPQYFYSILQLLSMVWLFSFAVGLFNMLPIYPLDGGLMLGTFLESIIPKKKSKKVVKTIAYLMVIVLLISYIYPLIF